MKNKIIFLSALLVFVSLIFLTLPGFAQQSAYTKSESITCGNGACETMSFRLKVGEEKEVEIAGETYTFRLLDIGKRESTYTNPRTGEKETTFGYSPTITVNGKETGGGQQAKEEFGFLFNAPSINEDSIIINIFENKVNNCAVPDCSFRAELDLYKKWNLVPLYFLTGASQDEIQLEKGTCKLQNFLVIYGYESVEKNYVKLHTYGKSENNLKNSIINFKRTDGTFINTPFNSVWVHSLNECELVAELPNMYENLLLLFSPAYAEGATNFASGWNFWTGSKDVKGKSFDEIKGSCIIEKTYTFDAPSQSWKALETPPGPATNFIFKVKDACMFGIAGATPPELPE